MRNKAQLSLPLFWEMPPFHPASNSFPMMTPRRLAELTQDIRKQGLLLPITLCEGKILDGRARALACATLGITPATQDYTGPDPYGYVWSVNGEVGVGLTEDQRAQIFVFLRQKSAEWQARHPAARQERRPEMSRPL